MTETLVLLTHTTKLKTQPARRVDEEDHGKSTITKVKKKRSGLKEVEVVWSVQVSVLDDGPRVSSHAPANTHTHTDTHTHTQTDRHRHTDTHTHVDASFWLAVISVKSCT